MAQEPNPHHFPDPNKRFQVYALQRGGDVRIDLIDDLERAGVSMPLLEALSVASDINAEAVRIIGALMDQLETLAAAEGIDLGVLIDEPPAVVQQLTDELEPGGYTPVVSGDRKDLRYHIVDVMNTPSHAIRDRRELLLRLTSEMAVAQAAAVKAAEATGTPFRTFESGVHFGVAIATVFMFGGTEGRAAMNRALLMAKDLGESQGS